MECQSRDIIYDHNVLTESSITTVIVFIVHATVAISIDYDCNTFTVATMVNYDRNTFMVKATG